VAILSVDMNFSGEKLIVFFEAQIKDGEAETAWELVSRMVALKRSDEPETLAYKIFINEH
tara:strand:- start:285 stop:464 length:180 start_codon:yes stop_codon:yes gene_type:complete